LNNLSDLSFFTNAIDTKTSGLDLVITYDKLEVGDGKLGFNLSGNYVVKMQEMEQLTTQLLLKLQDNL
jgi:iron complex outermembrane receptor protein